MDNSISALAIDSDVSCEHDFDLSCDTCRLRSLCLPANLHPEEIAALESVIDDRRIYPVNQLVYEEQQPFIALYAVVTGAVKTYKSYGDGRTSIMGCHLPGDLFGFSGLNHEHYETSAMTLQHTSLCEIPFEDLQKVCREVPAVQSQLLHLMSHRIVDYQEHLNQLASKKMAGSRLAAFLLGLSARSQRHGGCAEQFQLPMSAKDVANYLGIRNETGSREFARLVRTGVINKRNREITILDMGLLRDAICGDKSP